MDRNQVYACDVCNFSSTKRNHYSRHLITLKHKKSVIENDLSEDDITEKICDDCQRSFRHLTNYYRHRRERCCGELSYEDSGEMTYLNYADDYTDDDIVESDDPNGIDKDGFIINKLIHEKEEYLKKIIEIQQESYQKVCESHQDQIKTLKESHETLKESQETFKELAIKNNGNQTTNVQLNSNQIIDNSKTMQFLNHNMSDMIDMETFIENYKDGYQLDREQSRILLESYQLNGVKSYAKCLSKTLKDICEKQMLDRNIEYPNKIAFPLVTTDCNLRSVKIKTQKGWETITGDNDLSRIIVISNDQVYRHHRSGIYLPGSAKSTVIAFIKKDNSLGKVKNALEC